MRRLLGLRDFVHDAIEKTTNLVEETHESVAKKPIDVLSRLGPLGDAAKTVDEIRRFTAATVFTSVRATNRAVQRLEDMGLSLARAAVGEAALAASSEALASHPGIKKLATWADAAQSVFNAVVGDELHARGNGLDIGMSFRQGGAVLPLDRDGLAAKIANPSPKLCVFVHGLAVNETLWCLDAERLYGDPNTSFGTQLARDLGFTPLYLRYNTGRHIPENGRELAQLMAELIAAYPGAVEQIVLIGHSMGGLVVRSAVHYASIAQASWLGALSHVFCIGSPHLGAPLEQAGVALASVLGFFDTPGTQIPAKVLNGRSNGIKDLGEGRVIDESWTAPNEREAFLVADRPDALCPENVTLCYIAARLLDPMHPLGDLVGDLLVRVPSASGVHHDPTRHIPFQVGHVVEGVSHLALINHPDVYAQIKRCLTPADAVRPPSFESTRPRRASASGTGL